ncbi:MAG: hypothetical protein NDJ90_08100 [Oligoflexia bacterium]|nr:hypothetical protein [Oligoflexia bacterium]
MRTALTILLLACMALPSCASGPDVKKQGYAALNSRRSYEYELPVVWKGIEKALSSYKIESRDAEGAIEREIETDWMIGQSRDKYHEYRVNGSPRKKYLQTRFKFKVTAERRIGSTEVAVQLLEEIERLKADGTSDGYETTDSASVDSSRSSELLDKIQFSILSAAP